MRTLIYKRTHNGDPDDLGRFGIFKCMGQVRRLGFEAVIGVGGTGPMAKKYEIDGKVNWIGIGVREKKKVPGNPHPVVTFDHFKKFDDVDFEDVAPVLANRMLYSPPCPRWLFDNFNDVEKTEIDALLKLARRAPPSRGKVTPSQSECREPISKTKRSSKAKHPKRC